MKTRSIKQRKHVKRRVKQLVTHDRIRYYKILETVQYTILYSLLGFGFAILTNKISYHLFSPLDETEKSCDNRHLLRLLLEVTVQLCFISLCIFYIIKIVKIIPLFFSVTEDFRPYTTTSYAGGIAISFIFLKMQPYLSQKLEFIMSCVMKKTGTLKEKES